MTYALDFGAVLVVVEVDNMVDLLGRIEGGRLVDAAVEALDLTVAKRRTRTVAVT